MGPARIPYARAIRYAPSPGRILGNRSASFAEQPLYTLDLDERSFRHLRSLAEGSHGFRRRAIVDASEDAQYIDASRTNVHKR
jgi:hypothetical protein